MMTRMILFALAGLFFLASCGGGSATQESAESQEMAEESASKLPADDPLITMPLNTELEIEDWVAQIVIELMEGQRVPMSDMKTIALNDRNWEVQVLNPKGRVSVVRGATPNWTNPDEAVRYFTRDGHIVVFEEIIRDPEDDRYVIDRIYYANGELLSANTRVGSTVKEAQEAVPGEFQPEEGDIFNDYDRVRSISEDILALFHDEPAE